MRGLDKAVRRDPYDHEGRLTLGWFHWLRSSALTGWRREPARVRALHMFWPLFLTGHEPLPEAACRALADRAERRASKMLVLAQESTDHDFADATVTVWRQIVRWTSPKHPDSRCATANSRAPCTAGTP